MSFNYREIPLPMGGSQRRVNTQNTRPVPREPSASNTGNSARLKSKFWTWTWNNYPSCGAENFLSVKFKKLGATGYVYGKEIAPTTGTPHINGYVEFKSDRRRNTLINNITNSGGPQHWEVRYYKATRQDNIDYCTKDGNHVMWSAKGDWKIPVKLYDPMSELVLRKWQVKLEVAVTTPPIKYGRDVLYLWSKEGCIGKTAMAKHLCMVLPENEVLYVSGAGKDVKYAIVANHEEHNVWPSLVIWEAPRSGSNYVAWGVVEQVKSGLFFNNKYKSGMARFNSPHVLIFANEAPPLEVLSKDRWYIFNIDGEDPDIDLTGYNVKRTPDRVPIDLTTPPLVRKRPPGVSNLLDNIYKGLSPQQSNGARNGATISNDGSANFFDAFQPPRFLTPTQVIEDDTCEMDAPLPSPKPIQEEQHNLFMNSMPRFDDLPQFDTDGNLS